MGARVQFLIPTIIAMAVGVVLAVLERFRGRTFDVRDQISRDIELRKTLTSGPEDTGARIALTASIEYGAKSLTKEKPGWGSRFLSEWGGSLGVGLIVVGVLTPFYLAQAGLSAGWKSLFQMAGNILGLVGGALIGAFWSRLPRKMRSGRERKRNEK